MRRTDGEIKGDIVAGLSMCPSVNETEIRVYVKDGHVRLQGDVNTLDEKNAAGPIVLHTHGVLGLENDLVIAADNDVNDLRLSRSAQEALQAANLPDIGVRVVAGNCFLMGVVRSIAVKEYAEEVVGSVPGIRGVYSELEIAAGRSIDDTSLANNVVEAISENPQLETLDLRAMADDGKVVIEGSVPNERQWKMLKSVAECVPGVHQVLNHTRISVPPPPL